MPECRPAVEPGSRRLARMATIASGAGAAGVGHCHKSLSRQRFRPRREGPFVLSPISLMHRMMLRRDAGLLHFAAASAVVWNESPADRESALPSGSVNRRPPSRTKPKVGLPGPARLIFRRGARLTTWQSIRRSVRSDESWVVAAALDFRVPRTIVVVRSSWRASSISRSIDPPNASMIAATVNRLGLLAPASIFCNAATLTREMLATRRRDQLRASRMARMLRPTERTCARSKRISATVFAHPNHT